MSSDNGDAEGFGSPPEGEGEGQDGPLEPVGEAGRAESPPDPTSQPEPSTGNGNGDDADRSVTTEVPADEAATPAGEAPTAASAVDPDHAIPLGPATEPEPPGAVPTNGNGLPPSTSEPEPEPVDELSPVEPSPATEDLVVPVEPLDGPLPEGGPKPDGETDDDTQVDTPSDDDTVDGTADDIEAEADGDTDGAPPQGRSWAKAAGAVAVVGVVGAGAFLLGQSGDDDDPSSATTTTASDTSETTDTTETTGTTGEGDLVSFEDPARGISLSYPDGWEEIPPDGTDPDVVLILSAGGQDSVLVRQVQMAEPATEENLPDLKAVTDDIIGSSGVRLLGEAEVEVNEMPGYYYLYLFTDPDTGAEGVHAHYFLFSGRAMNILVFQAVPTENFDFLASDFDAVVNSFESEPLAAAETTTTTAG